VAPQWVRTSPPVANHWKHPRAEQPGGKTAQSAPIHGFDSPRWLLKMTASSFSLEERELNDVLLLQRQSVHEGRACSLNELKSEAEKRGPSVNRISICRPDAAALLE
jgi:hypothetical protein